MVKPFVQYFIGKRYCLALCLLLTIFLPLFSQEQSRMDSLVSVYESGRVKNGAKLLLLKEITENCKHPEDVLLYSNVLIKEARKLDSTGYVYFGLVMKGYAHERKSDFSKALASYFEAADVANKGTQTGTLYISIADVYSLMDNHANAVDYYQKAIALLKHEKDSLKVASALYNMGDEYLKAGNLDAALLHTTESQLISKKIHYQIGEAYCMGSLGMIYLKKGNHQQAEINLNEAIQLLEALNEYAAICEFLNSMAAVYQEKGNLASAKKYAHNSLRLAQKYGLKQEISEANLKLSALYEKSGDLNKSLAFFKSYITYRDSVSNLETVQKVADLRTDFEISKKQKEVDLLATRHKLRVAERNGFVFASLLLAAILLTSIYYFTQKAKRNKLQNAQKIQEAEILHQSNLMQTVISSQEAERKRIGMDLHDEVGAALSTLRIKIDRNDVALAKDSSIEYKADIDKIIENMRNISHALSPRLSGNFGFYDAIHELADGVNGSDKVNMSIQFDEHNMPVFNDEMVPMALYRVIAELINNTLKHAKASEIKLAVDVKDETMSINYSDNGIGIQQSTGKPSNGIGMQNIESRLRVIGARWQVMTPTPNGYELNIEVPLKQ